MPVRKALIDSAVALHADGRAHSLRDPCREIVEAAGAGTIEAYASVEFLQEYIHVARRHGNPISKVEPRVDLLRRVLRLHPFTDELIGSMVELLGRHPELETRDAVHLATAIHLGITTVVSPDRHFDGVDRVERVDPRDLVAVAALMGE